MSTYTGLGRTNNFRVTDIAALSDALNDCCVQIIRNPDGTVYLIPDSGSVSGQWDHTVPAPDDEDDTIEVSVPELVAPYLPAGVVAVFEHVGSEKHRYLNGYAIAIDSTAKEVRVDIGDVYALAEKFLGGTASRE